MNLTVGMIFVIPDGYPRLMQVVSIGDGLFVETDLSATAKVMLPVGTGLRGIWEDLPGMEPYSAEVKATKRSVLYIVEPDGSKSSRVAPER